MQGLTFRQLQVFVDVVDLGSFGACADRMGITQVSVSGHIRSLERVVGRPLFERRRGAVSDLTEDGHRMYRHAVTLLQDLRQLMEDIPPIREAGRRRKLVVAAIGYINFRLAHVFADFNQRHPNWQVEHGGGAHASLTELVARGRADVAFVISAEGEAPPGSIELWQEPLGIYVASQHPLSGTEQITAAELSRQAIIHLPAGNPLRYVVDKALGAAGVRGNPVVMHTGSAPAALRRLLQGDAICCMFSHIAKRELASGMLTELRLKDDLQPARISAVTTSRVVVQTGVTALLDTVRLGMS